MSLWPVGIGEVLLSCGGGGGGACLIGAGGGVGFGWQGDCGRIVWRVGRDFAGPAENLTKPVCAVSHRDLGDRGYVEHD